MGNSGQAAFCSVNKPGGYYNDDPDSRGGAFDCASPSWDSRPMCSTKHMESPFNCNSNGELPMRIMSEAQMKEDKINAWTKDMTESTSCGGISLSCGSNTKAPSGYLADTQDGGTIVLDSRDGPVWVDDAEDSRIVGISPDEGGDVVMKTPQILNQLIKDQEPVANGKMSNGKTRHDMRQRKV
mmetsp:Transcript_47704/g.82965  ORF Transcript_47704/g.82965 Transcript_47704/m.82965 type:complete len:183 (-) Transcript_47704:65-613(-)